jgi:hypothetical protein
VDFKFAPLLFEKFKSPSQSSMQDLKLQNFILFICSKEKATSHQSLKRNRDRLQKRYENLIKKLSQNSGQNFNFQHKASSLSSSSRHMSHYYTMLAHGIDLQTMNSLQRCNGLDDFLKSNGAKKKAGADQGKSWVEEAFVAMGPEQGSADEEMSDGSQQSLDSFIEAYATEDEDAILGQMSEHQLEVQEIKAKLQSQKQKFYAEFGIKFDVKISD